MPVKHDLKCSAHCEAPMQEGRVERRDGVLYKIQFGEDPVRAICDKCGADLQVALTTFAIGGRAVAASRPDPNFRPFVHARASYRRDDTGEVMDLGRVVVAADKHGCIAVIAGSGVEKVLSQTATSDEPAGPADRSNLN